MKENNKLHPHDKLIGEWLKDTSKKPQFKKEGVNEEWWSCTVAFLVDDTSGEYEFRFKPREFIKGHWYPCVDLCGDGYIYQYNGIGFSLTNGSSYADDRIDELMIGKSLGEIKFNE